jgi:hypothetical protein
MTLVAIGTVESPLTDREAAPKQGDEGAPEAALVFEPRFAEGLRGIGEGDELVVLTWLDRARRDVLHVHPRGDAAGPEQRRRIDADAARLGLEPPVGSMPVEYATPTAEDRAVEVLALLADRGHHRALSVPDLLIARDG